MKNYQKLLLENKAWAAEKLRYEPAYFEKMAEGQSPEFLWFGCSDSRVPSTDIVNASPGQIFVHRNVANLVIPSDTSAMSVLQYSVQVLKVRHIIVCGHYGCGGVKAAYEDKPLGLIDHWLKHIKKVYQQHRTEIDKHSDVNERCDALVEYNVKEQVKHLVSHEIVQDAWKQGQFLALHGWIYNMQDGILRAIMEEESRAGQPN